MRRTLPPLESLTTKVTKPFLEGKPPLISIRNAIFYRQHPGTSKPPDQDAPENPRLFPHLEFTLPSFSKRSEHWAIVSPSSVVRTTFLRTLRGENLAFPPTSRSYPYLATKEIKEKDPSLQFPANAIQYVGFDAERSGLGGNNLQGAYLSARYESRREETDFTLSDYLRGNTELNAAENLTYRPPSDLLERIIQDLKLQDLLGMPVSNLSNGQTRRARIAKALLSRPELLLLDGPFMGLDPLTAHYLSELLNGLAKKSDPRLILSCRPQDDLPEWITHVIYVDEKFWVTTLGGKGVVLANVRKEISNAGRLEQSREAINSAETTLGKEEEHSIGEPVIEMEGVQVKYGERCILGDWTQKDGKEGLWWNVRQGERWGIFGPNGSGKTTLLSLITSDHPQTYSAPVKLFQRSRLPSAGKPGISIFDLQSRMGHSSPEVHTFFPKNISVRRTLESAWADAPLAKPMLNYEADTHVNAYLKYFRDELDPRPPPQRKGRYAWKVPKDERLNQFDWADETNFGELNFSAQRVALFLRAIIRKPDLVILDEAFSGMDSIARDKCMLFLEYGESLKVKRIRRAYYIVPNDGTEDPVIVSGLEDRQALILISHSQHEVPGCVREYICLPEPGERSLPRVGKLDGPISKDPRRWKEIWGNV
ncbi:ABC transporter [Patellaria atrata CBS 101060]|uniref:ABC transporter n=1 Tax=Patellaria atrata CBS 101060 TaxID=1346257 RepID=A0A9P4VRC3_9PEZI|nr:ABC transporter [Patellaria atrata CBS 101060]